jgi:hypothetical protein
MVIVVLMQIAPAATPALAGNMGVFEVNVRAKNMGQIVSEGGLRQAFTESVDGLRMSIGMTSKRSAREKQSSDCFS